MDSHLASQTGATLVTASQSSMINRQRLMASLNTTSTPIKHYEHRHCPNPNVLSAKQSNNDSWLCVRLYFTHKWCLRKRLNWLWRGGNCWHDSMWRRLHIIYLVSIPCYDGLEAVYIAHYYRYRPSWHNLWCSPIPQTLTIVFYYELNIICCHIGSIPGWNTLIDIIGIRVSTWLTIIDEMNTRNAQYCSLCTGYCCRGVPFTSSISLMCYLLYY